MKKEIQARLENIETEEDVRILYACESGSRAWGFPSKDSDYDVRFIYLHPVDWYLSVDLERKRDVVEYPIDDQLDICGWDLRKALQLLRKFNPPLIEWLGSPIIYKEAFSTANQMRDLASRYFSPVGVMYHYFHMARGNYRDYEKNQESPLCLRVNTFTMGDERPNPLSAPTLDRAFLMKNPRFSVRKLRLFILGFFTSKARRSGSRNTFTCCARFWPSIGSKGAWVLCQPSFRFWSRE